MIKQLTPGYREVLLADCDAWKLFRQKESDLIEALAKEQYSGGGSVQSNIIRSRKSGSIKSRAIVMFTYYDTILKY
ncbi:hypothetical protein [Agriterribacter sp.]|uniref:hypothetical protein n=1 Tax=Agriterribacter sp. TaxID=2821509 RepID=UPI002C2FDEB7|nr:hypothetical protein [Agriterribacter sp.]HRP55552.1 hypothetical protein [Agriterribacter sp.]